jgi:hypothetical protein
VNGKIAKAVKESFGLENLSKRNKKPRSFLIQSFEQFKTVKTLLTILMLCGVMCGYAQKAPPPAASTMTWVIKSYGVTQTWSDYINLPTCNKKDYDGGSAYISKADCRNNPGYYYLYSLPYVKQNADNLCPSPWRIPTKNDLRVVVDSQSHDLTTFGGWCDNMGSLHETGDQMETMKAIHVIDKFAEHNIRYPNIAFRYAVRTSLHTFGLGVRCVQ